MKRSFFLLIMFTVSMFAADPWPGVQYAEVRAYSWPADKQHTAVIEKGMKLKDGAINKDGALLTPDQTKALIAAVTGKHGDYMVARCHNPHNAFVFYDSAKKPVAFIEICFDCFSHRTEPAGAAKKLDLVSIASIFGDHKLAMGKYADSAAFKKAFDAMNKRDK